MERETPRIYAMLENKQVDYHVVVVKVEGNISKKTISILIDLGYTHSYVTPNIVEDCLLKKEKHNKSWLVQLAMGTKMKVSEVVMECTLE